MPSNAPLVAPILLPNNSFHFAAIKSDGTVQDVINVLVADAEVREDILGDLLPGYVDTGGWGLQKAMKNEPGKTWEDEELKLLDFGEWRHLELSSCGSDSIEGLLPGDTLIAPLLKTSAPQRPSLHRHFSAFPLSSHLHTPTLRLVALHPALSLQMSFLRVPEIPDDYFLQWYLTRGSTADDAISSVADGLGLTRNLGGTVVPYVIEEIVCDADGKECKLRTKRSRLFSHCSFLWSAVNPIPGNVVVSSRLTPRPRRKFRLVVPDEWYRRSRHRSLSASPARSNSPDIIDDVTAENVHEEDADEDGDGTAKVSNHPRRSQSISPTQEYSNHSPSTTGSQSRLSSMFETWRKSSSPRSDTSSDRRLSVSNPVPLMAAIEGSTLPHDVEEDSDANDEESMEFERMLDELGLKGPQRLQMIALPSDRKRYLITQNRLHKSASTTSIEGSPRYASQSASYSPASAAAIIPKLVPQLTGDVMKRFSLAGIGWGSSAQTSGATSTLTPVVEENRRGSQVEKPIQDDSASPLVPQSTGGLWGSWWASPATPSTDSSARGSSSSADRNKPKTCAWYVDNLRPGVLSDTKLAKHLISLRVHLSTAKLAWIEKFVVEERGMELLGQILEALVGKGSKRRRLPETDDMILAEVVKCFRVLLNTEVWAQLLRSRFCAHSCTCDHLLARL